MKKQVLGWSVILICGLAQPLPGDEGADFFRQRVLPLLEKRCFQCHSHASRRMENGLALDSRSGWVTGGDSGPAVIPGKPDESLLVEAVRRTGLAMPPDDPLPESEVGILVDWVQRGAPDPRIPDANASRAVATAWWAVQPLVRPEIPVAVGATSAIASPIDRFVLTRLHAHGLSLAPAADRRALIRRLTFDLHGLPPTPAEVDAFVADSDPQAYEKLVDRLLASPRYGERFARLWLDVAHYGESDGFGMDRPRMHAWPYRDYVIDSLNVDKAYGRFIQEQLAADALYPDEPQLIPALGFLAAGPFNQSALVEQVDGTLCKRIALNLDRDDMVSSVATTFLSVTLHCARCHEHKFDPISMQDYYRMQSVFAGVVRGDREFDQDAITARQRQRWSQVRARLGAGELLQALDNADRAAILAASGPAEASVAEQERRWKVLAANVVADSGQPHPVRLSDGSIRLEGNAADKDTYVMVAIAGEDSIAALRLEVLADDALPHRGPGRQPQNGNLHLSEIKVLAAPASNPDQVAAVKLRAAVADFNQSGWEVAKAIDGNPDTAWGIHPQEGRSHQAVFVFDQPVSNHQGTLLTVRLEQLHGGQHVIGRLRLSVSDSEPTAAVLSPDVARTLADPAHQLSADEQQRVVSALAPSIVDAQLNSLPPARTVLAVGQHLPPRRNYKPPPEPYSIHVLRRGDVMQPLQEVQPGALEAVSNLPAEFAIADPKDEQERRAALARWIADSQNPLTWRSMANRLWQWHFNRGLVETPNDFGRMGSPPSHPHLLDWLACELRDRGGSLKELQREIVCSATYRQAVVAAYQASRSDSDNRLLWRMNRRRLDAEQLRDAMLAASGQLDLRMGGPSAMQFNYSDPNPEVVPRIDYDGFDPDSPAGVRRGVYRFLFRNINDPLLEAFDAVNPSLSTPQRTATITPLQALSLLNSRFVLRQSEHLAQRLANESQDISQQIELAYRLLFARPPTPDEAQSVSEYARRYGMANACRVLFNSNEFQFLE